MLLIEQMDHAQIVSVLEQFRFLYIDSLQIRPQSEGLSRSRAKEFADKCLRLAVRSAVNSTPYAYELPDSHGWGDAKKMLSRLSTDDLRWVLNQVVHHMEETFQEDTPPVTVQTACKIVDEAILAAVRARVRTVEGDPTVDRMRQIIAAELTDNEKTELALMLYTNILDMLASGVEKQPREQAEREAERMLAGNIASVLFYRYAREGNGSAEAHMAYRAKLKELGLQPVESDS